MSIKNSRFSEPTVVDFYEHRHGLEPAEDEFFNKYVKQGTRILDVGVGAGRTAPYLSAGASRYVGVDNSLEMLKACRRRFPKIDLVQADASALDMFAGHSFDAVVFSFNGIDFLETDAARHSFLAHCSRMLTPGGLLVFSSHNARYLCPRPTPVALTIHRMWRWFRSLIQSKGHLWRVVRSGVFLKGEGYIFERAHGGIRTHYASPENVKRELSAAGFQVLELLPHGFPWSGGRLSTAWYHYACRK